MRLIYGILAAVLFSFTTNALVACADENSMTEALLPSSNEDGNDDEGNNDNGNDGESMEGNITIIINSTTFTAILEDNASGQAFAAMLPLALDMSEMNGNEKYCYLDVSLPTESYRPGTIQTGDLMLYGSSCVTLFYETFSSGYNYTRLGRINNPEGLAAVVGRGDVSVSFTD